MKKKILTLAALLATLCGCGSLAQNLWSQAGQDLGVNFTYGNNSPAPMPQDDGPRFFDGH